VLLSIIIPVYRDTDVLDRLLAQIAPVPPAVEVLVSATDEQDERLGRIRSARPDVVWIEGTRGRGPQLNAGAARAAGRWLWFVHADSRLPNGWLSVFEALDREASPPMAGSFQFRLTSDAWQARWLERLVDIRTRWLGLPYGDQGIFVRREVFQEIGGFRPIPLMEDVELVRRVRRIGRLRHLNVGLETSARRWVDEGWWRRSARNLATMLLYLVGVSPERLAKRYDRRRG
jgi:rSAM/selenodomain-associated transferase 2